MVSYKVPANSGWTCRVLLLTDLHWDHPGCNRRLLKKLLDEAKATGSPIIDNGDLFCAMEAKDDPRRSDNKRDEHRGGPAGYLQKLVTSAADWFEPYAGNFICMGTGNHETSVYKHRDTNLTAGLVQALQDRTGHKIGGGGFTGWVRFRFARGQARGSLTLWYGHGWGRRNFDIAYRQAEADIYFLGHTHEKGRKDDTRLRLNGSDRIERRDVLFVQGPSFKDGYGDGHGGFEVERGHGPKPLGAWWLTMGWEDDKPWADVMTAR